MASIDRLSGSRNLAARFAIALGSGVLLGMNARPGLGAACPVDANIALARDAEWRCELDVTPGAPYLLTVTQEHADLAIRVENPATPSSLEFDSPTHRAGSEILLLGAEQGNSRGIVIRALDRGPRKFDTRFKLIKLASDGNAARIRGLSLLTQAAQQQEPGHEVDVDHRLQGLDQSAVQFAAAGDKDLEAEAHWRMAATRYWRGDDWEQAAKLASEAASRFDEIGDPIGRAHADTMRGAALIETGNAASKASRTRGSRSGPTPFDEAEALLKKAADAFQRHGLVYFEAEARNHLGIVYFYEGRYPEARARWAKSVELFDAADEDSVLPLQNLAVLDFSLGDYDRAIASYERLFERLDSRSDLSTRIAILDNLGVARYVTGRTDEALTAFVRALDLMNSLPDQLQQQHRVLHNLGVLYHTVGDPERATVFLEQALALRRLPTTGDPRGLLTSLLRVGDLHRERGQTDDAIRLHLEALELAGSPTDRGRALLAIAEDHLAENRQMPALEAAESAHEIGLPQSWPLSRSIESTLTYVRVLIGEPGAVDTLLALAQANLDAGDADLAARDFNRLAFRLFRQGLPGDALNYARHAIAVYEQQRVFALNPDLRATYVAQRASTYDLQTEILLTHADQAGDAATRDQWVERAVSSAELRRMRTLAEFVGLARASDADEATEVVELDRRLAAKRHRLASLQERTEPPTDQIESLQRDVQLLRARLDVAIGASRANANRQGTSGPDVSLAALRRELDGKEVLLTYLGGIDHYWLVAMTREAISFQMIGSRRDVEASAGRLQRLWSQHATDVDPGIEIDGSRKILGRDTDYLRHKLRIIVVPDDTLRRLPFAALRFGSDGADAFGRRLGEDFRVSYRASLSRFDLGMRRENVQVPRILLVGAPNLAGSASDVGAVDAVAEFSPLPGARRELEEIAERARDWQVDLLVGADATKTNLWKMPLADYQVLHFATHARLDVQDPQLSAIALSAMSSSGPGESPMLNLREVLGLDLRADAVVLSTCDSSLGKSYRAQTSVGLSEAFLLAGAQHVLGSLWRVPDAATRIYMDALYAVYFSNRFTLEDAVAEASRGMMARPRFRHPYYWAAFVVTSM